MSVTTILKGLFRILIVIVWIWTIICIKFVDSHQYFIQKREVDGRVKPFVYFILCYLFLLSICSFFFCIILNAKNRPPCIRGT